MALPLAGACRRPAHNSRFAPPKLSCSAFTNDSLQCPSLALKRFDRASQPLQLRMRITGRRERRLHLHRSSELLAIHRVLLACRCGHLSPHTSTQLTRPALARRLLVGDLVLQRISPGASQVAKGGCEGESELVGEYTRARGLHLWRSSVTAACSRFRFVSIASGCDACAGTAAPPADLSGGLLTA